jgi:hypothetical protein
MRRTVLGGILWGILRDPDFQFKNVFGLNFYCRCYSGDMLVPWRLDLIIECPLGLFEYAEQCLYQKELLEVFGILPGCDSVEDNEDEDIF